MIEPFFNVSDPLFQELTAVLSHESPFWTPVIEPLSITNWVNLKDCLAMKVQLLYNQPLVILFASYFSSSTILLLIKAFAPPVK